MSHFVAVPKLTDAKGKVRPRAEMLVGILVPPMQDQKCPGMAGTKLGS